jgi:hypothetical protein
VHHGFLHSTATSSQATAISRRSGRRDGAVRLRQAAGWNLGCRALPAVWGDGALSRIALLNGATPSRRRIGTRRFHLRTVVAKLQKALTGRIAKCLLRGHERKSNCAPPSSAFPSTADLPQRSGHVSFV